MMEMYLIVVFLGLLVGSLVNGYIHWSERSTPLFKWYLTLYYSNLGCIALEVLLAAVYALLYKKLGLNLRCATYALLMAVLAGAAVKDLQGRVIPNRLVIFGAVSGCLIILLQLSIPPFLDALLGLVVAGGVLGIISLVTRGGVGMGDVKLFACAGIFLGLQQVLNAMIFSILLSGIAGVILLVTRKLDRKGSVPFAPFIFMGTVLTLLLA